MRFIVKEQPYEKKLASGLLKYEQENAPTGAVESWRLTTAVSGYRLLRVDLDARDATSGNSALFHLVQTEEGQPERLMYRFWNKTYQVEGNLIFEADTLIERRTVNGTSYQLEVDRNPNAYFWFPSTVGLGLLASAGMQTEHPAYTIHIDPSDPAHFFEVKEVQLSLTTGPVEPHLINEKEVIVRPLTIEWDNKKRSLWLDDNRNWPLKMVRDDGLTAVETHNIWY